MDAEPRELNRRSFIMTSAGVATGAAVVGAPAAIALRGSDSPKVLREPSSATPPEPIVAYVRDARRGEITVLSGTAETTYRDPALVERLVAAAQPEVSIGTGWGR
jgi:hypothetical protein